MTEKEDILVVMKDFSNTGEGVGGDRRKKAELLSRLRSFKKAE